MRIAHFTTSYPRHNADDAGIFIKRLIGAFSAKGMSGYVIVPWDYKEVQTEEYLTFKIFRFRYSIVTKGYLAFGSGIMPNIRANPLVLIQAPLMLMQFFWQGLKLAKDCDLLHAHWAVTALPVCLLGKILRKPVVITLHGEDLRLVDKAWLRPLFKPTLEQASLIVCVNKSPLSSIARSFPNVIENLVCIPYGVETNYLKIEDVETFKKTKICYGKNKTALFVGSVIPRKKIDTLIEALAKVEQLNLIVCGRIEDKNYFSQLRTLIEKYSLKERIFFEGAVNPEVIKYYMSASDIYVSASEHEGRPNAVLEALASGKPVVLSDIPAHREFVMNNENGILFSLNDAQGMAKHLAQIMNDTELRNRLSANSLQTVASMSWQNCAENYIKYFSKLIS